ncbi:MAG: hypothetical protein NWS40_00160, partial [Crocinitomicaceae bacterium]|nr:hypothetical protein [Crocinitomicaceae bacterium]
LIGATQIIDASGGLTIGTVGSNSGLLGSGTIRVETLAGNLTLASNISTTNATTDAVILTAAKSTAIGTPAGGDILVTGSPTITMATGGIAKLYSGYDMTSTGLSTFVGTSNVRYNYDETSTTINPALSANNKYAFYRTGQGYGDLNIVSTAGDAEGSTWSYANGVITTISGTANVSNTAIQNKLNSGNLSIEANKITFSASITGTTSNSLNILSKTHIVNTNATTITTLGGDVLFASNVDDATDGESTVNGGIYLAHGLNITTVGGDITLAGGNTTGSGYAMGNVDGSTPEGIRIDAATNLNSDGGNIILKGKSAPQPVQAGVGAWGVGFYALTSQGSINSGTGTILIDGHSQSSGSNLGAGVFFYTNTTFNIQSANTTASAITINAFNSGSYGQCYGMETESSDILNIFATAAGGGISLNSGFTAAAVPYDYIFRGQTNILAVSGPITIKGGQFGGTSNGYLFNSNHLFLGSKAATLVTSSTSNIVIQADNFNGGGLSKLATIGSVNIKPTSTSFGTNTFTSWFNFNQNGQTMTSFTFGKPENTGNLYLNSDFTVAGPMNVYGGYVQVSSMITSSADGDLLLKGLTNSNLSVALTSGGISKTAGIGTILMQGHGRVQTNGVISATGTGILNLVMWSDYDGDNVGGGSTLGAGGSISTNGGHVWIGGSSSNGGTYTWNGLSVGDGPSVGASGCNCNAIDLFGPITTDGGDVLLWAGNNGGCGTNGIQTDGTRLINVGIGDIALIADQTGGNVELTSTGIISLLPHAGSYASALTLGGTTTSGHFTFNTSHYNGLKINSLATTGLVIGQYAGHLSGGTA